MGEPLMTGKAQTNVFTEHVFMCRVLLGSSVVTSYRGKDVTFARNSAGNYTLTLPQPYAEITRFSCQMQNASGAVYFGVIKDASALTTTGAVVIEMRTEAGTATDPASGDKLFITLGVSRDTLNDTFTG